MRVTEIEVHEITLEQQDWIRYPLEHYGNYDSRRIYVAHTDDGLYGLGEGGREAPEIIDQYIGTSPFDWVGDETSLPLGTAMYDLMGKAAGVPVYKLFGQKVRSWVPAACWTVSTHPDRMVEAVQHYAARGFTWMKFHLSPFENVFDQTEAMEKVAPASFRLHYDFTGCATQDHMPDLLIRLSEHPIAGCFEDAINAGDTEASIELRRRVRLPILRHQAPLDCTYEVLAGAGDGYIRGHQKIGAARHCAGLFAAGNIPFSLQNVGGHITRAMVTHMMAAFPSANLHFNSCTEIWKSDIVKEQTDPVNGFLRVSEAPGLGVTLDRAELERLKSLERRPLPRWIIRSRYGNGTLMYNHYDPQNTGHFLVLPNRRRGIGPMSFAAPLSTDYWDDDGSPEFAAMMARLDLEGMVLEKAS